MSIKIPKPVLINIKELKPHPNNLKKHTEAQITTLTKLIEIVGFKDPIVIDKKFNIKAGHGRLEAAKKLKMETVPCIYIEGLTQKQMDLFMYLDNHVNESPWIQDNINLLFQDMPLIDLEQFPEINWEDIIPQEEIQEGPLPELPVNPKSKLGDMYQLGKHTIICGDCTQIEFFQKLLKNVKLHLVIDDPPYNIGFSYKKYKDKKSREDYTKFCKQWFENIKQYCENIIITPGPRNIGLWYEINSEITDLGTWREPNSSSGATIFNFRQCEPILFYGKYENKRVYDYFEFSASFPAELKQAQSIHNLLETKTHAPAKPLKFIVELIKCFTKKEQIICDNFLGNGTTLIAAEHINRICYGMEIDPAYIDVIIERWENFTGKKATLIKNA